VIWSNFSGSSLRTSRWRPCRPSHRETGFAPVPVPVGDGNYSLADGARRRLEQACRRLDGSRALVIALAEGKIPEIVVHTLERRSSTTVRQPILTEARMRHKAASRAVKTLNKPRILTVGSTMGQL
jgi:hypothetical protein